MKPIILIFLIFLFVQCGPKLSTELSLVSITADSRLRGIEAPWEHDPLYLLDENPKTNWCGDGETASITLVLSEPIEIETIEIINGNASSPKSSLSNGQVSKLKIIPSLEGKKNTEVSIIEPKKVTFDGNGKPKGEILNLVSAIKGDRFEFQILESTKGATSANVCITEIKLGRLKSGREEFYPLKDKSILSNASKEYEKSKKQSYGYGMLLKYSQGGGIVDFCDVQNCMVLSLSTDGTFTFGDYLPIQIPPDSSPETLPNFKKTVTGSFKLEGITSENGTEISFKFFDSSGIETTELWYLKVVKKGDREFDTYKTMTGENFKLFDSQNFYLLYFESKADNSYHKEMKLFTTAIPIKI